MNKKKEEKTKQQDLKNQYKPVSYISNIFKNLANKIYIVYKCVINVKNNKGIM